MADDGAAPSSTGRLDVSRGRWSLVDAVAVLGLLGIAIAVYGRFAAMGGWFYDDWAIYSTLRDRHGGFAADVDACARSIPGGRGLSCVYHAGVYSLFGSHRSGYQFAALWFLALGAGLLYVIARQCGLSRPWAFLLGAGLILFPASDSSRLWPVAAIGLYVIALVLGAFALKLAAMRRRGRPALALAVLGAVLALAAMATYEIAVPLIAVGGATYYLRDRNRRAIRWWAGDIGLVLLFAVYRLTLVPVSNESTFLVHRDASQTLIRGRVLLQDAWSTWKYVYLPGWIGTAALVAVAVVVAALCVVGGRSFRKRAGPWLAVLALGMGVAAAGALAYLTANDLYAPQVSGTFNRVNLPGSLGYVAMAVAIVGLVYAVLIQLKVPPPFAAGLVALVVAGSVDHQVGISRDHIGSWEASWHDQKQALSGYRVALRGIPHTADIVGFDTPLFERGYIPAFAATWDLRGALDYETNVDPTVASPLLPAFDCGTAGVSEGTTTVLPYDDVMAPLYFVSPVRHLAIRVKNQSECELVIREWGRPPQWGYTVTGVRFTT